MISLLDLGKHFSGRTLFEGVSLKLHAGARYGLVGANGSGKTTLLKILVGDEQATSGSVALAKHLRIGVLRQDQFLDDSLKIIDVAMAGDAEVHDALRARDQTIDPHELARLDDVIERHQGWSLHARAASVLEGLGIETSRHEQPLGTLSGGFKLRVLLAQVLLSRPDALLLDEPTNHLDILSIRWLEKLLCGFAGCAVVISHDQRFLENIATHILDVDYGSITVYPGGFQKFVAEKELRREQKESEIQNKLDAIEHKRAFVERFGAKNTKARQAQSRLKQIEKIEADLDELPPSSRREPMFRFDIVRPSGKEVVALEGISKAFGTKRVLSDVTVRVRRGEKIAVVGENGIGKSTLLKIAMSVIAADGGKVGWGHEAQPGYFAQDHKEMLTRDEDTPLVFLSRYSPETATAYVRGMLGKVLFSGDDVKKPVGALSGGEAARLLLCKLMVEKPNALLLDEPTNHLDLEAIRALVDALKAYEGTLVFVSHDRWFVNELADRVIELKKDGLRDFPGSWSEYLAACGDDHLDADAVTLKRREERGAAAEGSDGATSWEDAKKKKSRRATLEKKRDKALADVERHEARREEIRALWCADGFYEKTPLPEQKKLQEEEAALTSTIDALMQEWERIEVELGLL